MRTLARVVIPAALLALASVSVGCHSDGNRDNGDDSMNRDNSGTRNSPDSDTNARGTMDRDADNGNSGTYPSR